MTPRDLILILSIFLCPPAALVLAAMFSLGELITWADERNSRPVSARQPLQPLKRPTMDETWMSAHDREFAKRRDWEARYAADLKMIRDFDQSRQS